MADRSMGGGPAFPVEYSAQISHGMSLRDWFAGQALAGLLGTKGPNDTLYSQDPPQIVASSVYALADAMIAERAKAVSA